MIPKKHVLCEEMPQKVFLTRSSSQRNVIYGLPRPICLLLSGAAVMRVESTIGPPPRATSLPLVNLEIEPSRSKVVHT